MAADNNNSQQVLLDFFQSQQSLLGRVKHTTPVSGGCINTCLRLDTTNGPFFLKYNSADAYPGMMTAEAQGLQLLGNANSIGVPKVLLQQTFNGLDFLLLEWIAPGDEKPNYWVLFGEELAALHHHTSTHFGLHQNNYIGSLKQDNTQNTNGIEFFIENRLQPQLQMAIDKNQLPNSAIAKFETLYGKLPNLLPSEPPALLHGDLWQGNFLTGPNGHAWLVDPSVQYSFREAELAFTQLFGGFSYRFYEAYHSAYPIPKGFNDRADIYNLYPLLVHVNLFGGSYANQVMESIKRFL